MHGVTIEGIWLIVGFIELFDTSLLVTASNGGRSSSSGFPNFPRNYATEILN
jgi:hypothetical protein